MRAGQDIICITGISAIFISLVLAPNLAGELRRGMRGEFYTVVDAQNLQNIISQIIQFFEKFNILVY
jgi:hypothetical protein